MIEQEARWGFPWLLTIWTWVFLFYFIYLLCMFFSHRCFRSYGSEASCTEALVVTRSVSDSTLPSDTFSPRCCSVPDSPTHHLSHFASTSCHMYYFHQNFSANKVNFKILIHLFLRALERKCFSFSLWESVSWLSTSTKTSWCHGRRHSLSWSTNVEWAVSSCFVCSSCFPNSLV